jgi:hypothetical protein
MAAELCASAAKRGSSLLHGREGARFRGCERRGHPATLQRFGAERADPACLQNKTWGVKALDHENARAAQGQFDRGEEADWPRTHDDYIGI